MLWARQDFGGCGLPSLTKDHMKALLYQRDQKVARKSVYFIKRGPKQPVSWPVKAETAQVKSKMRHRLFGGTDDIC